MNFLAPVHVPRDSSQPGAEDLCWGNGCCTSDLKGIRFKVMRFTTSAILLGCVPTKNRTLPRALVTVAYMKGNYKNPLLNMK